MPSGSFVLSRSMWLHHMHIMYACAALSFVAGLAGPKYGSVLATAGLIFARGGVLIALVLWVAVQIVRRRTPDFSLREVVSDHSRWNARSSLERAGLTALFISLAVLLACLGALIGTAGAYFVWRLT